MTSSSRVIRLFTSAAICLLVPFALFATASIACLVGSGEPLGSVVPASLVAGDLCLPAAAAVGLVLLGRAWLSDPAPSWEIALYGAVAGAFQVVRIALPGPASHDVADALVLGLGIGAPVGCASALLATALARLPFSGVPSRTSPRLRPRPRTA